MFYAPNVNSYKRLKEPSIGDNWNKIGFNTSDCGVNIIEEENNKKLHFNLAGADVNQYLCIFGILNSVRV
jgi:glutamine synthetase